MFTFSFKSWIIKTINRIKNLLNYKRKFGAFNIDSIIGKPLQIDRSKSIYLGKVRIGAGAWLAACPFTGMKDCALIINNGCVIGHFNHIYATGKIIIEENVLTADRVYISDNLHGYENIHLPIKNQPIKQNGRVIIGEGSWLGENVCVLGSSIGKHCVIGSNAVVTRDIPDYCVAVGVPARIVKRYNFETQKWEKTDKYGNFINQ